MAQSSESAKLADVSIQSQPGHEKDHHGEVPEYLSGGPLYLLLCGLLMAVFTMALDISIVATALPRITDTFDTITDIGWYGSAYIFCSSALQPLSGKIYTFFSMKWSFVTFVAVFELGSLLCGTATSSSMFIVGRAVAGLGSSGLVNGALSIMALAGSPEKRPMFMGLIMATFSSGQILGPLIGGALTQHATWRWCFYINLPIGAATVLFLALVSFPSEAGIRKKFVPATMVRDFDLIGFIMFVPSIIMLIMALQWGGIKYAWSSATIIGLFIGFGLLIIPLCWWEKRHGDNAMFPFALLRQTAVFSSCATAWLTGSAVTVISYYLPLWFQSVKLASAFQSAVDTLPSFLSQIIFAILVGALCPKVVPYMTPFALLGAVLNTVGAALLSTFEVSSGTGVWIGYQIVSGAGRGLSIQVPIQIVQQNLAKAQMATGIAMVSFFQLFGGAVFVALAQTAFSNMLKQDLRKYAPNVDPVVVLESGATDIRDIIASDQVQGVLFAYNAAITKVFYIVVGACALSLITAFGMGWKQVAAKTPAPAVQSEKVEESSKELGQDSAK